MVVAVAGDRAELLLDAVVAIDRAHGRERLAVRAERGQRARPHLRALQRDRRARVVLRRHERCDAERPPQRAGKDAETDHAGRLEPAQHRGHERALEHGALEREAVDQQRRMERVERRHADVVERARSRPPEVGLAGLDVADQAGLGGRPGPGRQWFLNSIFSVPPLRCSHRGRERLELGRVAVAVGEGQHGRLRRPLAARLVGAAAPAAAEGESGEGRCERLHWLGWDASLASFGSMCPEATSGRRGAHRGRPGTLLASGARVCPDAPRVEVVRGCAREAAPSGRARRRSRARGDSRSRSSATRPSGSLAGRVGRRERRARRRSAGRWSRAASSHGRAGRRVASGRCSRPRAAPGSWSSSTTRAPARRSLFTLGLLGYAACPALVAHAALALPGRPRRRPARARRARARLRRHAARARAAARARLRPRRAGLHRMPGQSAGASRARPTLVEAAGRAGPGPRPRVGACCSRRSLALGGSPAPPRRPAAARRRCCCRPPPTSRSSPPTTRTALDAASSPTTRVDHGLWLAQAAALALLVLGVAWAWVRERRARTRVARLVIELGRRARGRQAARRARRRARRPRARARLPARRATCSSTRTAVRSRSPRRPAARSRRSCAAAGRLP